ncbi:MAG: hypothetical protein R6U16_07225, partial [Desulfotignum sp.]
QFRDFRFMALYKRNKRLALRVKIVFFKNQLYEGGSEIDRFRYLVYSHAFFQFARPVDYKGDMENVIVDYGAVSETKTNLSFL